MLRSTLISMTLKIENDYSNIAKTLNKSRLPLCQVMIYKKLENYLNNPRNSHLTSS